jgi:uncharacterized protein (DUF305 family)
MKSSLALLLSRGTLCLVLAQACAAQRAPIVQPGAPGQSSRILPSSTTPATQKPSAADVAFMQGMIMHHAQAVEMTNLLKTRSHGPAVQALGRRIGLSQTDEMRFMKAWLTSHAAPVSTMPAMPPMDHTHMNSEQMKPMEMPMPSMPLMPGMLTAAQMEALRHASGAAFDRLFLAGMIQHHGGALVMVKELFNSPGAGQDADLFDFATDVDNTQRAEIHIMQGLLKERR